MYPYTLLNQNYFVNPTWNDKHAISKSSSGGESKRREGEPAILKTKPTDIPAASPELSVYDSPKETLVPLSSTQGVQKSDKTDDRECEIASIDPKEQIFKEHIDAITIKISQINNETKQNELLGAKFLEIQRDAGPSVSFGEKCYLVREGNLIKYSGDKSEKYYFVLTNEALLYFKRASLAGRLTYHLSIPLATCAVKYVTDTTVPEEFISKGFVLYSKIKSFYLVAKTPELRDAWFCDISKYCS